MANYFHNPDADNTAATKTVAAATGCRQEITHIEWSYDSTPAAGSTLTVESPSGTVIFKHFITAAGPGQFNFDTDSIKGASGAAVIVTLAASATEKGILSFSTRTS